MSRSRSSRPSAAATSTARAATARVCVHLSGSGASLRRASADAQAVRSSMVSAGSGRATAPLVVLGLRVVGVLGHSGHGSPRRVRATAARRPPA